MVSFSKKKINLLDIHCCIEIYILSHNILRLLVHFALSLNYENTHE